MEIEKIIQREYNPAHPNFERWQTARDISVDRAKFVENILSTQILLQGLKILDIGAGEGNTSKLLSTKNYVISLEPKFERIKKIPNSELLNSIMTNGSSLPFKSGTFDLIILQDVIEHLNITEHFVDDIKKLLKQNGIIYLSTPNRFSLLNIISDPHWGAPIICLFKREQIKKYFLKYFRKTDFGRDDIAELLSLNDIVNLFGKYFSIKISTKFSVDYLLRGGKGLVWSKFHLWLLKFLNDLSISRIIRKFANDKIGLINKFFTPTFYIILKKK